MHLTNTTKNRTTQPVLRFAPSPNGPLHLGHARSALIGYRMSKELGGRFLLRIEDIDTARSREEYIAGIKDDLVWLGIAWEEPVVRQSEHFPIYAAAAQRLQDIGLLYPCFASRTEILGASDPGKTDPEGIPLYPGISKKRPRDAIERDKAMGLPYALRLDMERAVAIARRKLGNRPLTFTELDEAGQPQIIVAHPERWGDAIIVRKDTPASYHLAVVVDDARQGISHVTRGRDLYAATDIHRLLQVLLDLPEPLYHHHALIVNTSGRKLSKSEGATSLRALRERGLSREEVVNLALADAQ